MPLSNGKTAPQVCPGFFGERPTTATGAFVAVKEIGSPGARRSRIFFFFFSGGRRRSGRGSKAAASGSARRKTGIAFAVF